MSIKKLLLGAAASLCVVGASSVFAEGYYVGAQFSEVEYEQTGTGINDAEAEPNAFVLIGGYNFSEHIALEGRYAFDAGDDNFGNQGVTLEVDSIVSLLGKFSLGGTVSPYLLVGLSDVEITTNTGQVQDADDVSFGAGVDFNVSESFSVGLEYIQYAEGDILGGGEATISALSLGANYKF